MEDSTRATRHAVIAGEVIPDPVFSLGVAIQYP
jgi:hypothetical protein